jgi:hypothetical protein
MEKTDKAYFRKGLSGFQESIGNSWDKRLYNWGIGTVFAEGVTGLWKPLNNK